MKILILLLFWSAAILLVAQSPGDVPPTTDPDHEGQPEWCQRENTPRYKANCEKCERHCDDDQQGGGEDSQCKVYCRRSACACHAPCTT